MNRILVGIMLLLCTALTGAAQRFVKVDGQRFVRDGKPYPVCGTNMWYAAILGSTGQGGDRQRLLRELDELKRRGITNIRALAGGSDGVSSRPSHTWPSLQPEAGVYNDTLLAGLDFFVAALEERGMTCVLYLNNAWDWSGGFGTYLEWAGCGPAPDASQDWDAFQLYLSQFTRNERAMRLADNHVRFMVGRTSTVTGQPYTESPAIMAWEVCNEPRPFVQCPLLSDEEKTTVKRSFARWIGAQARLIKSLDPNHLVTTGSEGYYGCARDTALLRDIHAFAEIDYCSLHCWPNNWGWCGPAIGNTADCRQRNGITAPQDSLAAAIAHTRWYIDLNNRILGPLGKPVVLEEYGYPRDNYEIAPGTPVTARCAYYRYVDSLPLAGRNFWGWAGEARPPHARWQRWDPYTADPAQEEQGLYSVFDCDE